MHKTLIISHCDYVLKRESTRQQGGPNQLQGSETVFCTVQSI